MARKALIRVRFHGAVGEVTGSRHLVEALGHRVLLDCGLIQGGRDERGRNAAGFGFDPSGLDAVVASHAHIDHIGRLPLLVRRGYAGPIYATRATADLARIMLEDSARLAAADAERDNRGRQRRGEALVEPLYLLRDVHDTLRLFKPMDYGERREILPGITLCFEDAGHILGAAIVELVVEQSGQRRTLVFSGDLGPDHAPIMRDPTPMRQADLVLMESTYGDRNHRSRRETIDELGRVLEKAHEDGGNVLIPAFAVGRSQELLYWLARYWKEWGLERWQIILDSPMAARVTELYQRHTPLFDAQTRAMFEKGPHPFRLPNLRTVVDVQDSMAVNRRASGQIIIAGSGMCNGGRIRHHLRHNLWRENCDIIFVGYQARGTLGRQLVDGADFVNIFGEKIRVRARRHTIGGLSAHADQGQLAAWYGHFNGHPPVALVHGEDEAREALAGVLQKQFRARVTLARARGSIEV
ncbi:MBL fold metallo-hydrolase RNA specificity domain-containing protein [Pseudomarimonas salicorniae]|uniref:MBL fold metallo-hydrolase n=1 Tax=Pseudomarimonas salicorniae TaxID=2933270 RepID=A0ABT0GKB3_9GAMM|nr:MBL fold metallo-hydrolase [Lysobacter sp. CAU 1642]MCK7594976.1 MBL fold metallo-hydrolase [Lysobacter sp. CAU 1642]